MEQIHHHCERHLFWICKDLGVLLKGMVVVEITIHKPRECVIYAVTAFPILLVLINELIPQRSKAMGFSHKINWIVERWNNLLKTQL